MALGIIKIVHNIDRKFGADDSYHFLKVQDELGHEEYLLVTQEECTKFSERAAKNPEDLPGGRRGRLTIVTNTDKHASAKGDYYHVSLVDGCETVHWLMTDFDLERIRQRVEKNAEDIEANRESWLADLLD